MKARSLELDPPRYTNALKALLNQEGFRLTNQRQKILDLFETDAEGKHLSAEEIQQHLSGQGEKISFSTIYRALHVMVKLGLLRELEMAEGRKYYELNNASMTQHHHLVCVHCGAFQEFEDTVISRVGNRETQSRGYALLDCQFTVYGICPNCQED